MVWAKSRCVREEKIEGVEYRMYFLVPGNPNFCSIFLPHDLNLPIILEDPFQRLFAWAGLSYS